MCVNQPQIGQWNKIERSIGKAKESSAYLKTALRNPSFDMNKVHALRYERKLFNPLISYVISIMNMEEKEQKEHIDIQKETLKPITKTKSKEDKELKEQEVESTGGGMGAGGG